MSRSTTRSRPRSSRACASAAWTSPSSAPRPATTIRTWTRRPCSGTHCSWCCPRNTLAERDDLTPEALDGQPWIAVGDAQDPAWRDTFVASCVASGFTPDIRLDAADPLTALGLVASGLGLALIQRSMVRGTSDGVAVRELPWYEGSIQLWAAWHRVDLRPVVAEFRATVLAERGAARAGTTA